MKTTRHTRAAELLTNNVPPAKGTEQLGNSVQVFLTTYAEWIEEYSGLDNALLERKVNTESQTKFDFRVLKLVKSLNLVNIKWRRRRDSNSRWAINPRRFSRPLHSTTLPPLRRERV